MECVYPAIFQENDDKTYTITFPDLPGCISEGKSLVNAMHMAEQALAQWVGYLADMKETIPKATPSTSVQTQRGEFVNLIRAVVRDNRAVRRTVSIPKWMDEKVIDSGLSLSRVLQDALSERLPRDTM
jgi:predicted RNase H-like HicB family nuclease